MKKPFENIWQFISAISNFQLLHSEWEGELTYNYLRNHIQYHHSFSFGHSLSLRFLGFMEPFWGHHQFGTLLTGESHCWFTALLGQLIMLHEGLLGRGILSTAGVMMWGSGCSRIDGTTQTILPAVQACLIFRFAAGDYWWRMDKCPTEILSGMALHASPSWTTPAQSKCENGCPEVLFLPSWMVSEDTVGCYTSAHFLQGCFKNQFRNPSAPTYA